MSDEQKVSKDQLKEIQKDYAKKRYKQYLESEYWQNLKDEYITEDSYCEMCGNDETRFLLLHHLNYKHLWYETREDFQILCPACHSKKHKNNC